VEEFSMIFAAKMGRNEQTVKIQIAQENPHKSNFQDFQDFQEQLLRTKQDSIYDP
jgi:hypothetical protein